MLQIITDTDEEKIYNLLIWRRRKMLMPTTNEAKIEQIELPHYSSNSENPEIIVAQIIRAEKPLEGNPIVVFGHGNGETLDDYIQYSINFCPHGISICALDYRGYGYSDGLYGSCSATERDDVENVINHLKKEGFNKISYFGRSLGATCGIFAASKFPDLVCLALDSPWMSTKEWVAYRSMNDYGIKPEKFDEVIGGVFEEVKRKTGIDFNEVEEPRVAASRIKQPIYVIHGVNDTIVPYTNSEELINTVQSRDKKLESFEGDHNDLIRYLIYEKMFKFILKRNGVENITSEDNLQKVHNDHLSS